MNTKKNNQEKIKENNQKKRGKSAQQIISIALCVIVFAYIIYNAAVYSYTPVSTVVLTEKSEYENTFEFKGFVVRDEKEIADSANGVVIPLVKDGKRVAKGDSIAVVCSSEENAAEYKKLENAKEELERYKALADNGGLQDISAEKLNLEINGAYGKMMDCIVSGNYEELNDSVELFNSKSATKQMLAGEKVDVNSEISRLEGEISSAEGKKIQSADVSAPQSGNYINIADGYENVIKYEDVLTVTEDKVNKALDSSPAEVKDGSLGKLVSSYRWYVVGITDAEHTTELSGSGSIKANFPESGIKGVKMNVESVRKSGDNIVVVLSCDLMNEVYANMRKETVQVVTGSGTGFKVPVSAVRFDSEDNSGVFVFKGKMIKFVPAQVLYSDGEYAVVSESDGGVALYDEVVIKGRKLKDGDVIRR